MKPPNFFIVGAPKSGTTALCDYLRQHPDVFMSRPKELHFFGNDLHRINCVRLTTAQYLAYFSAADHAQRVGEASTSYLYSRSAAQEIKDFSPAAKIVIMLRSPVDVMVAYHSEQVYGGFEEITDFAEALEAEEQRRRGLRWPTQPGILENLYYRDIVRFTDQVQRYLDIFGPQNVHIIIFDDFTRDTAASYARTLVFLGLSPGPSPRFEVVNPNKRVRSRRLQHFVLRPPGLARDVVHALVPRLLRAKTSAVLKRWNTAHEPRPPLDPAVRRRLQAEYSTEIARLSALLGRDLSHWSSDAPGADAREWV